jgi:hypothetical protein
MRCEICDNKEATELINLGLDIGYHLGDYGISKIDYIKKPDCVGVCSIRLCGKCKTILKRNRYFKVDIFPKLKELIKKDFIKKMIIRELKRK